MMLKADCGEVSQIINIITAPLICSAAQLGTHHPFLKVCCGQLKLPNWVLDGNWVVAGKLDFGKTFDLTLAPWLYSFGTYIL
jgi:hypothetical protein